MECPSECPDCGVEILEWEVGKVYKCCECVKRNGKVFRVKKGVKETMEDPEVEGSVDWAEIEIQEDVQPLSVEDVGRDVKGGLEPDETTKGSFEFTWKTIALLVLIFALIFGMIYYYLNYIKVSPKLEFETSRVLNLRKDLEDLQAYYPTVLPLIAISKSNPEMYLKGDNIKNVIRQMRKSKFY